MTDHAREAAEKIDETIRKSTLDYDYLVEVIQAAIDAACAERDKRIAKLEEWLTKEELDAEFWRSR